MAAPDVNTEDQQRINVFHKSWQRLKEINAELEGRAVSVLDKRTFSDLPHCAVHNLPMRMMIPYSFLRVQKLREDYEDASNELMLIDDAEVSRLAEFTFYLVCYKNEVQLHGSRPQF